jgi:hypothetical protein
MKKVGIITYHDIADGKGRFLQAYALYSAIKSLGYDAEIIDYYPDLIVASRAPFWKKIFLAISDHNRLRKYFAKSLHMIMKRKYRSNFLRKRELYNDYIKKNIKITPKKFFGRKSVLGNDWQYDAYVCGSDQIWNPYFQGTDKTYYLDFAPTEKRIAYAPSLGTIEIDEERKKLLKENIKAIPFISVREKSGAKLVEGLIGRNIIDVLDPTLLMNRKWWKEMAGSELPEKPYLLTFFFDNSLYPRKVAKKIAKKHGFEIVNIPDSFLDIFSRSKKEITIGPERFVNLFMNASFICTQSFHGLVLSLIFEKSFYVFDRKVFDAGMFSRIKDLLEIVHLEDRILIYEQKIPNAIMVDNYVEVNRLLEKKRKESLSFLSDSLNKASEDY